MITVSLMMYPVTLSQTKARVGIQQRIEDKDDLQADWQGEQRRAVFHGEKQRKEKTEEQQAGIVVRPKDRTRTRCIRYCLLHLATIPTRATFTEPAAGTCGRMGRYRATFPFVISDDSWSNVWRPQALMASLASAVESVHSEH